MSRLASVLRFDWSRLNAPELRRRALFGASVLFVAGCAWSIASRPDLFSSLQLAPALLQLGLAIPLTMALNANEFWLTAHMLDARVPFRQALEVSTLGSAANLLPIPGAFLVRVAQLRAGGVSVRRAASVNAVVALMWIAVSFGYAGLWLRALSQPGLAHALWAAAVASLVGAVALLPSLSVQRRYFGWILLNKIAMVLLESLRVLLCFQVLGVAVVYAQAAVMVAGSVVGSAVSIVPAGLGIREAVSAALAPIIGVQAADGFLVAATGRVLEVLVLVPLALLLARRIEPPKQPTGAER